MRVLFLTQIIPFPPDAGPRIKTWQVLNHLAERGHQITLASFVRPEEEPHIHSVKQICKAVHTVPIRRSRTADVGYWLSSQLTGRPFLVERDYRKSMKELVTQILATEPIDIVHVDQLTMAQFADGKLRTARWRNRRPAKQPFVIYDAHNAVWTILDRMRRVAPTLLRPLYQLEARRIRRYEGRVVRRFDHTVAVSDADRCALQNAADASASPSQNGHRATATKSITVIPIAVDTERLQPVHRRRGSANILAIGTLHYPPNADGVRWFTNEVFPLVRQRLSRATLTIVGKNPPSDFLNLAERHPESITVHGYVSDLLPYLEKAALMVVPVRVGGGMRVRILEGFARGMPMVTTSIGQEGIDARPGVDLLIADDPLEFAEHVLTILNDEELQKTLASNGRRRAEELYSPHYALAPLDLVYQEARSEQNA